MISAIMIAEWKDINNSTGEFPGADDNVSGVSALLEIMKPPNVTLNHGIIFVLFAVKSRANGDQHIIQM